MSAKTHKGLVRNVCIPKKMATSYGKKTQDLMGCSDKTIHPQQIVLNTQSTCFTIKYRVTRAVYSCHVKQFVNFMSIGHGVNLIKPVHHEILDGSVTAFNLIAGNPERRLSL